MLTSARQTWLSLRQNVAMTLRTLRKPALSIWREAVRRLPLVAVLVVLPIVIWLLLRTEPIGALAIPMDSVTFLAALLGAQAAVAALTLAVMLFLLQGVSARRDVDDRVYAEYIRRSWVWPVFFGSIGAVAVTGSVLVAERVAGNMATLAYGVPGLSNLALLAIAALFVSLATPVVLFARAIRLAEPEHWQGLRLDVNKREVSGSVGAFLGRLSRAATAHADNAPDFSVLFPGPGERSADQAVRALLDDARRAMDERRHGELARSLNSIQTLVTFAMDEIEAEGVQLGMPGSEAQWPPLEELRRSLYSYREEVIRSGTRDYLQELLSLDYWFISTGLRRPCGDLFTFGLSGYRWNYELSARIGSSDFHAILRDGFLIHLNGLTFGHDPESLRPFMRDVIRHQGTVLSHALHSGLVEDYLWMHREFSSILSDILEGWDGDVRPYGAESEISVLLRREYRIALMGLAGRAVILFGSGKISDANAYLDAARAVYTSLTDLADDIPTLFDGQNCVSYALWQGWEIPDHLSMWSGSLSPERYPLTCFSVLFMERVADTTLRLNLHGHAERVLNWFVSNSESLERYVRESSSANGGRRRELAIEVLREAVRTDVVQEDLKIISRELSAERIASCRFAVQTAMDKAASVYRIFDQAGALVRLVPGVIALPDFGLFPWPGKAYFVDPVDGDQTSYAPVDGDHWGRGVAQGVIGLLCDELEEAIPMTAALDTLPAFGCAVDAAIDELETQMSVGIVVAGDWGALLRALHAEPVEAYEPYSWLTGLDPSVNVGRYRGFPVLRGPTAGERRVYVFDIRTWGTMVYEPFGEGQGLLFDVKSVSADDARELLAANPDLLPDEPDYESKVRKLQTLVQVRAFVRVGFRRTDSTRARRVAA